MILVRQYGRKWADVIVGPPVPLPLQRMAYGHKESLPRDVAHYGPIMFSDWPTMGNYQAFAVE